MFLLRCPKCRQQMKYQSRDNILTSKTKRCVYCGRTFKVRENIVGKHIETKTI